MNRKINLSVLSVLFLISTVFVYDLGHTHSGRTDSRGGHYNRKTGEYHYHNSGTRARARTQSSVRVTPNAAPAAAKPATEKRLPTYPVQDFSNDTAYPVVAIVDGDTIKIQYQGKQVSVRLIGVDTPETVHPSKPVETFGKEASNFTKNLLLGEHVYLRSDTGTNETDKYGRLLSYVFRAPDGLFVNLEIVRQGYGHAYTQFPFKLMELFRHYGNHARNVGKGLYAAGSQSGTGGVATRADRSAAIEAESESTQGVTVYITRTGKKYHRSGCQYLSRSKIPISLSEAKQRYGPCSRCNPPHSSLNEELKELPATNPNPRLDRAWLNRIYPNANKVSAAKISTGNQTTVEAETTVETLLEPNPNLRLDIPSISKIYPPKPNPNLRLNRIYPNANKVSTAKVSTENQSSSKPKVSSSKYPACKVCGGGSVVTKYGKKSHSSTCRYVTNTKYPTRSTSSYSSGRVRVKGYYRKDGTYVRPHTRRKPRR